MTPEEETKIRIYCEKYWGIGNAEKEIPGEILQWLGCEAPVMLTRIDSQAVQIINRNAEIERDRSIIEFLETELKRDSGDRYADLQAVCDDQGKQITALKEIAIREKAWRLKTSWYLSTYHTMISEGDDFDCYTREAREQLEAEHPGVMR